MELRQVSMASLDLSLGRLRLLPEPVIERMAESMRGKGQLTPLVATERDEALVLVDGFIRHAAAARLGLELLLVEVVALDDVQMKAQVYLRNQDRGLMLLEECRLVHELNRVDGLDQVEIGVLLERHKSWVCRRLSLYRTLSPHLRDDGTLHRLGGGSIRRLAQLPHRNQEQLAAVIERERLAPREASSLIDLWRRATGPEARQYLAEQPKEAIRLAGDKRRVPRNDPRLGLTGQVVTERLVVLEQVSLRIIRRLDQGVENLSSEGAAAVEVALQRSVNRSGDAFDAVRQWLGSAGGQR